MTQTVKYSVMGKQGEGFTVSFETGVLGAVWCDSITMWNSAIDERTAVYQAKQKFLAVYPNMNPVFVQVAMRPILEPANVYYKYVGSGTMFKVFSPRTGEPIHTGKIPFIADKDGYVLWAERRCDGDEILKQLERRLYEKGFKATVAVNTTGPKSKKMNLVYEIRTTSSRVDETWVELFDANTGEPLNKKFFPGACPNNEMRLHNVTHCSPNELWSFYGEKEGYLLNNVTEKQKAREPSAKTISMEKIKIEVLYKHVDGKTWTRCQKLDGMRVLIPAALIHEYQDADGFNVFDDKIHQSYAIYRSYSESKEYKKSVFDLVHVRPWKPAVPEKRKVKVVYKYEDSCTFVKLVYVASGFSVLNNHDFSCYTSGKATEKEILDFYSQTKHLKNLGYPHPENLEVVKAQQVEPELKKKKARIIYEYRPTGTFVELLDCETGENLVDKKLILGLNVHGWHSMSRIQPCALISFYKDYAPEKYDFVEAVEKKPELKRAKLLFKHLDNRGTWYNVVDEKTGEHVVIPSVESAILDSEGFRWLSVRFLDYEQVKAPLDRELARLGYKIVTGQHIPTDRRLWNKDDRIADLEKINKNLADKLDESNGKIRHLTTVCDSKADAYVTLEKAFARQSTELAKAKDELVGQKRASFRDNLTNLCFADKLPVRTCTLNSKTNKVIVQLRRADNNEWIFSTPHVESQGLAMQEAENFAVANGLLIIGEIADRMTYGDRSMIEEHRKTKEALQKAETELQSLKRSIRSLGGIA